MKLQNLTSRVLTDMCHVACVFEISGVSRTGSHMTANHCCASSSWMTWNTRHPS